MNQSTHLFEFFITRKGISKKWSEFSTEKNQIHIYDIIIYSITKSILSLKRSNILPSSFSRSTSVLVNIKNEQQKEDIKQEVITISDILEKSLEDISLSIKQSQESQKSQQLEEIKTNDKIDYIPLIFSSIIQLIWTDIEQFLKPNFQTNISTNSLASIHSISDMKLSIYNPNSLSFIPNLSQNGCPIVITIIEYQEIGVSKISILLDSTFSKNESELFINKINKYLQ